MFSFATGAVRSVILATAGLLVITGLWLVQQTHVHTADRLLYSVTNKNALSDQSCCHPTSCVLCETYRWLVCLPGCRSVRT